LAKSRRALVFTIKVIFWDGSDKYWIVSVRKLFHFHHCSTVKNATNQVLGTVLLKLDELSGCKGTLTKPLGLRHQGYCHLANSGKDCESGRSGGC